LSGHESTQAAKYLNISRKTLIYRMEKFGLQPSEVKQDRPEAS
jgi:DNA-binding NtrC family response regulator